MASNYVSTYTVNVYDISGRKVVTTNNNPRIDLSSFDNGTYIIHVISEVGEVVVKKVSLIK